MQASIPSPPSQATAQLRYARVLTIAGSDAGGGAGIQADLKTFSALGCYGMTAITAITAQNTCGVRSVHAVPSQLLRDQIDAVVEDIGVDAVKIGMLHDPEVVQVVAQALDDHGLTQVVLDPVLVAANGAKLISDAAMAAIAQLLVPRAVIITPNVEEAAMLLGQQIASSQAMPQAALDLLSLGAQAVLLKGAHLAGNEIYDYFVHGYDAKGAALGVQTTCAPQVEVVVTQRIVTRNCHGAGCTLSSAIAAYLALGCVLPQAVHAALAFVQSAIQAGAEIKTGQGVGPLNHGFAPTAIQVFPS